MRRLDGNDEGHQRLPEERTQKGTEDRVEDTHSVLSDARDEAAIKEKRGVGRERRFAGAKGEIRSSAGCDEGKTTVLRDEDLNDDRDPPPVIPVREIPFFPSGTISCLQNPCRGKFYIFLGEIAQFECNWPRKKHVGRAR